MLELVLFLFAMAMAFAVAFAAGSNDEMMAPGVAARVFSLRVAVLLGAVFSVFGAVALGKEVVKTIGTDLIGGRVLSDSMIVAVLLAMIIILVSLSVLEGIPLSTTQAVVGAVIGVAFVAGFADPNWGIDSVDYAELLSIFSGWIISPIIGFIAAATTHFWLIRLEESVLGRLAERRRGKSVKTIDSDENKGFLFRGGIPDREIIDRTYAYALGVFLIISTASRAGNDVANSIAPVLSLKSLGSINHSVLLLVGGVGMAVGLVIVGHKVIKVVAREIVSMNPASALSAMISVTLVMTLGTLAGFPLSGTHVLIFAMIAVGWAEKSPIQQEMVKTIIISWIVTVPIAAILGAVLWIGVDWLFVLIGLV
ncbi:MAG: inorganic phosphate transporter [Candidatus Hodarchaeales archaeon]